MKFLALLIFIFSFLSHAADIRYNSVELIKAPPELAQKHLALFKEQGFYSLADQNGIPSLGVNQVFYKTEREFVLVKYGVEGEFPLNEIIPAMDGFLVHKKENNENYALFFRGFNREFVTVFMNRFSEKVTSTTFRKIQNLFISSAHATECWDGTGAPIVPQSSVMNGITAEASWNMLKSCMSDASDGIEANTIGAFQSTKEELKALFTQPIEYFGKVADKVELFLVKTAGFMKGLVTNPEETFRNMGRGLGGAWESVRDTVVYMSTEMKINFVCNFLGALGVDAAIGFLTAGLASEKVLLTINNLARKFSMIGKFMKVLGKTSNTVLAKIKLSPQKLEQFMKELFNGKIPDKDLSALEGMTLLGEDLGLRTLSCYI